MSVNKVIILGNLGRDPELKYTQSGTAICNLTVATTRKWKGKDGNMVEETEWHRVVVWGTQAENANKYLAKGRQVYIEGRLKTDSYEKEGQKHYSTTIQADVVHFIGGGQKGDAAERGGYGGGGKPSDKPKRSAGKAAEDPYESYASVYGRDSEGDDIPF